MNLTDIEVSAREVDDRHSEITVEASGVYRVMVEPYEGNQSTAEPLTDAELATSRSALAWGAGIVARVGGAIAPMVTYEGQQHGCDQTVFHREPSGDGPGNFMGEGCGVSSGGLLDPTQDYGASPGVWITVPTDRVDHYIKVIKNMLRVIAEAGS